MGFWDDPDFDLAERGFYHVRVLEIPTLRWTPHDAACSGVQLPERGPATRQDRAYTLPIWSSPVGRVRRSLHDRKSGYPEPQGTFEVRKNGKGGRRADLSDAPEG